jgi:hypothetical protein
LKRATAESGTIDSWLTLTAAPVEVEPRPEFAIALVAALRTASALALLAAPAVATLEKVPGAALLPAVAPTLPPAVLT